MKIQLRVNAVTSRRPKGFTLIELMVAVSIVAILSAIAYPSYRNYVLRGQIVSATNGLAEMRANMERFYQDNRTYATSGTFVTPCATPTAYGTFTLSCNGTPTAIAFSIKAVGSGSTNGFTYTVDNTNVQATTIVSPAPSSWVITCPSTWSIKAGQC